ncbi:MAG: hypothetical protein HOH74_15265 [Gemmatimonadetes bacterium]|nr:hypothetical protein [Gemmatimonadota bacterium]
MKRAITVFALATMLFAVSASAHQGDVKFMFQFPAGLEPTLDGELDDWAIVPEVYYSRAENMFNQYGAPLDLSDFNSFTVWGYSLATNKAYFAYWVADDMVHNTEKWSTTTDWDHTGGQFRSFSDESDEFVARWAGAQGQRYDIYGPTFASGGYYVRAHDKAWAGEPPYLEWGGKYLKGEAGSFEPAELQGEVAFVPWDDAHPDGAGASTEHQFATNQIVGIETNWGDKDSDPGAYDDAYWSIFGGIGASKNADVFGDYLLAPVEPGLPTAVTAGTWGQVKASFAD